MDQTPGMWLHKKVLEEIRLVGRSKLVEMLVRGRADEQNYPQLSSLATTKVTLNNDSINHETD